MLITTSIHGSTKITVVLSLGSMLALGGRIAPVDRCSERTLRL